MKILIKVLLSTIFCIIIIGYCSLSIAWWDTGHELIGQIAANNLTAITQQTIAKYLKTLVIYPGNLQAGQKTVPFIRATTWCDIIKNCKWKDEKNKRINSMLHYINPVILPNQKISIKYTRKTIEKLLASNTEPGKYNCYTALQSSIKTMMNSKSSLVEKAVALRFILHLVGDIHMPLHTALPIINGVNTRGGNKIVFGKTFTIPVLSPTREKFAKIRNLHALWDAGAGLYEQLPYHYPLTVQTKAQDAFIAKKAQSIIDSVKKTKIIQKKVDDPHIINWAIESNMIATKFISVKKIKYFIDPKKSRRQIIGKFKNLTSYLNSAHRECGKQIFIGGMRMANLLNAIFDSSNAREKYTDYVQTIKTNKNIPTLKNLFPNPIIFERFP